MIVLIPAYEPGDAPPATRRAARSRADADSCSSSSTTAAAALRRRLQRARRALGADGAARTTRNRGKGAALKTGVPARRSTRLPGRRRRDRGCGRAAHGRRHPRASPTSCERMPQPARRALVLGCRAFSGDVPRAEPVRQRRVAGRSSGRRRVAALRHADRAARNPRRHAAVAARRARRPLRVRAADAAAAAPCRVRRPRARRSRPSTWSRTRRATSGRSSTRCGSPCRSRCSRDLRCSPSSSTPRPCSCSPG